MIFKVNTDGTVFTNLHNFAAVSGSLQTNSDGAYPVADLLLSGNTLYGTTYQGGLAGNGTVFKLNTDGTGFTNLHVFTATSGSLSTNSDGSNPSGSLILSGTTLYGTAADGGSAGNGTVFARQCRWHGLYRDLHTFAATSGSLHLNSDGAYPVNVVLSGSTLYGTTDEGGIYGDVYAGSGNGTVFRVNLPMARVSRPCTVLQQPILTLPVRPTSRTARAQAQLAV